MRKSPPYEDDTEVAGRRAAGVDLLLLDGLGAEVDWPDEISAWIEQLPDPEFHRILQSKALRDAVSGSRLSLSTIRSRSALDHAMRELGISPAQLTDAVARGAKIADGADTTPSNVVPLRF